MGIGKILPLEVVIVGKGRLGSSISMIYIVSEALQGYGIDSITPITTYVRFVLPLVQLLSP